MGGSGVLDLGDLGGNGGGGKGLMVKLFIVLFLVAFTGTQVQSDLYSFKCWM